MLKVSHGVKKTPVSYKP